VPCKPGAAPSGGQSCAASAAAEQPERQASRPQAELAQQERSESSPQGALVQKLLVARPPEWLAVQPPHRAALLLPEALLLPGVELAAGPEP